MTEWSQLKAQRVRLDRASYAQLCRQVLERDGWHCQVCGSSTQVEVHHITYRSHRGGDAEENLMLVCALCHQAIHRKESLEF